MSLWIFVALAPAPARAGQQRTVRRAPAMARAQAAPTRAPTPAKPKTAKASAAHATPTPRPPREKGVKVTPLVPLQPVTLDPHLPKPAAPAEPTGFDLFKSGPGKLTLRFRSTRPNWEINPRSGLAIQLIAPEPLVIEPSIILRENWPMGAKEITLTYRSAAPGKPVRVQGGAAYLVCEAKSKECRKTKSSIDATITP